MNRRRFLILGGLSTLGIAAGSATYRVLGVWWDQSPAPERRILSTRENLIAEAIVDAIFPGDSLGMPNGNDVAVVDVLDRYLAAIPESKSNLLRLLLHAIDEMALPVGARFVPFHRRNRPERVEILARWDSSRLTARQEAFGALKIILSMGYCESPRVIRAAGIDYECGGWR